MPTLHFYKARDANIVVILRGHKQTEWEMIRWDLDTDTFTEGQWLRNKHLDPKSAAISPNGEYFVYGYDTYPKWNSVAVASKVPYFTAEYFQEYTGGRIWFPYKHFDEQGRLVDKGTTPSGASPYEPFEIQEQYQLRNPETALEKVNDFTLVKVNMTKKTYQYQIRGSVQCIDSGYVKQSFTDPKRRLITTEEGKLFADGELLYDTTDHVFRCVTREE